MANDSNLPATTDFFHFEEGRPSFEDLAKENGQRTWSGRLLMDLLGYTDWKGFNQVINKAVTACMTVGAPVIENFIQDGDDYKLTKFACYLVAMNGDPKRHGVAHAQAYFAAIAVAFQKYIRGAEDVQRIEIRHRVTEQEKALVATANSHGVENYAYFQDKGYRGLYNMSLGDLRRYKGDPSGGKRPLLDFMGPRELAANLFRITETEARIERDDVTGQHDLEQTAFNVGRSVRNIMVQSGEAPEALPLSTDIKKLRTELKHTAKALQKADQIKEPGRSEDEG